MTDVRIHRVGELTWEQVRDRLAAGATALVGIGAGAKEHGLHLPMGTDLLQADWLGAEVARRLAARRADTLIWPTIAYGAYPAFVAYAGSVTLSEATHRALVGEIVTGLVGFGATRVVVIDTGISTIAPTAAALAGLDAVLHVPIHAGRRYRAAADRLAEQTWGTHADELETSRMLVIAPDAVDMAQATDPPAPPGGERRGALDPIDRNSPNYSPTGATGRPSLATRAKGAALLEAMLADIMEAIGCPGGGPPPG